MINSVNLGFISQDYPGNELDGIIENIPNLKLFFQKINYMDIDIARQFLRAVDVYKTAVNFIGINNALSFFLLTVSVECLSNKSRSESDKGTCDSFINFILKYYSNKSCVKSEQEFKDLLKEIYYIHRSGFTHGGKELPQAVNLADSLNRVYVKNFVNGIEKKTPSLIWFESVVRNTVTNYLLTFIKNESGNQDRLKEISLEHGVVQLKTVRQIDSGEIVTDKDFDFD